MHSLLSKDVLAWTITDIIGFEYRVGFRDSHASEEFAVLANFWTHSRVSGEFDNELHAVVKEFAGNLWESEEDAFTEIDAVTSTFALFADSI